MNSGDLTVRNTLGMPEFFSQTHLCESLRIRNLSLFVWDFCALEKDCSLRSQLLGRTIGHFKPSLGTTRCADEAGMSYKKQ